MSLTKVDYMGLHFVVFLALFYQCYGLNCRSGSENKEQELQRVYKICQKRHSAAFNKSRVEEDSNEWFGVPNYRKTTNYRQGQNQKTHGQSGRKSGTNYDSDTWDYDMNIDDMKPSSKANRHDESIYRGNTGRFAGEGVNNRPSYSYTGGSGAQNPYNYWNNFKDNDDGMAIVDFTDTSRDGRINLGEDDDETKMMFERSQEGIRTRSVKDNSNRYRRIKRSRPEMNSGSRSQYNPNTSKKSSRYYEDAGSMDSNSKNKSYNALNGSKAEKACALHCYLENLGMTAADGLPDRYLVTHVLTKDITSEDLKDFLVESIEECFQILENEHTEDKCEFSKNILMCLSEKGKANCDDWRDDSSFKVASHRINSMVL